MKIPDLKKINFDGVNLVTASGVLSMCQDPNEFDSFYTHSVLNNLGGVLKYPQLFFMNASERVYLLENILEKEGILRKCTHYGYRSHKKWTELRPPYSKSYTSFKNIFRKPLSRFYEKREVFFGLFTLRPETKVKTDITKVYRLQATDFSYVSGQKVSDEFYCRIEDAFLELTPSERLLRPKSTISYTSPYGQSDGMFFFEKDIIKLFTVENVKYQEIDIDCHYLNGEPISNDEQPPGLDIDVPELDKDVPVIEERAISSEELNLLCILHALVNEALNSTPPRFQTINQLYNYPREKYEKLQGISESSVRSKIKEAQQLLDSTSLNTSNERINTRTERTLFNIIAILFESITNGINSRFKDVTDLSGYLVENDEFVAKLGLTSNDIKKIMTEINNDFSAS